MEVETTEKEKIIIICSIISAGCSFLIIIIYLVFCIRNKLLSTSQNSKNQKYSSPNDTVSSSISLTNSQKSSKIGLGSLFMFLLVLSNFFYSLFCVLILCFFNNKDKIIAKILPWFILSLDILSLCFISAITTIFNDSKKNLLSGKKKKKKLYALITYSILSPLALSIVQVYINKNLDTDSIFNSHRNKEGKVLKIIFSIFIICNIFYILCLLFKILLFYSKNIKETKQMKNKYKDLLCFVLIFSVFVLFHVFSRTFNLVINLIPLFKEKPIENELLYVGDGFHYLNGAVNSITCVYFFRKIIFCCCSNSEESEEEIKDQDISISSLPINSNTYE